MACLFQIDAYLSLSLTNGVLTAVQKRRTVVTSETRRKLCALEDFPPFAHKDYTNDCDESTPKSNSY
ncbi:hypothetical protein Y032_0335g2857 [Ancylostoma ceylanicum]|uniref:Uncharacterized protein n=1 Tax=Ancylostoma ceylanicum TaxID=53326 RepID=A0A016RYR3_9BILA|nr:hypothetical protein Y032_0335g2857 [Ancylostoma ceylanicum]